MTRKVPVNLSTARAYWRLAAKARRAGNYRLGGHYQATAEKFHRLYVRDKEAMERMKKR